MVILLIILTILYLISSTKLETSPLSPNQIGNKYAVSGRIGSTIHTNSSVYIFFGIGFPQQGCIKSSSRIEFLSDTYKYDHDSLYFKNLNGMDNCHSSFNFSYPQPRAFQATWKVEDSNFLFFGGIGNEKNETSFSDSRVTSLNDLWLFKPEENKWKEINLLDNTDNFKRSFASYFTHEDEYYLIGGIRQSHNFSNAYQTVDSQCTVFNDILKLSVFGSKTKPFDERYFIFETVDSNQYPEARSHYLNWNMESSFFLFGGFEVDENCQFGKKYTDFWKLNKNTMQWSQISSSNSDLNDKYSLGTNTMHNKNTLFFYGGLSSSNIGTTNSIYSYDTLDSSANWKIDSSTSTTAVHESILKMAFSSSIYDETQTKIYIFGGCTKNPSQADFSSFQSLLAIAFQTNIIQSQTQAEDDEKLLFFNNLISSSSTTDNGNENGSGNTEIILPIILFSSSGALFLVTLLVCLLTCLCWARILYFHVSKIFPKRKNEDSINTEIEVEDYNTIKLEENSGDKKKKEKIKQRKKQIKKKKNTNTLQPALQKMIDELKLEKFVGKIKSKKLKMTDFYEMGEDELENIFGKEQLGQISDYLMNNLQFDSPEEEKPRRSFEEIKEEDDSIDSNDGDKKRQRKTESGGVSLETDGNTNRSGSANDDTDYERKKVESLKEEIGSITSTITNEDLDLLLEDSNDIDIEEKKPNTVAQHRIIDTGEFCPISLDIFDEKLISRWGSTFAHGSFGTIKKGYIDIGNGLYLVVAIKIINVKDDETKKEIEKEVRIMKHVKHKNLLRTFGCFFKKDKAFIVMEYCSLGDLYSYKKELDDEEKLISLIQIAEGMKYLHQEHFVHRDLKTQNVLALRSSKGIVCKVCDFGSVGKLRDGFSVLDSEKNIPFTLVGTPEYLAPEITSSGKTTSKHLTDIFSFGITAWEIFSGQTPFKDLKKKVGGNVWGMINAIREGKHRPDLNAMENAPEGLNDIIEHCWANDPTERYQTFDVVSLKLQDVYLNKYKKKYFVLPNRKKKRRKRKHKRRKQQKRKRNFGETTEMSSIDSGSSSMEISTMESNATTDSMESSLTPNIIQESQVTPGSPPPAGPNAERISLLKYSSMDKKSSSGNQKDEEKN